MVMCVSEDNRNLKLLADMRIGVWIGYSIAACFICATGRIGAVYHIAFPVVNRSSFGIWGSLWPVLNRSVMACVWYGVQSWIGGTCVYLMIRSIWPSWDDYKYGKNTMSDSSGTNTRDFVSFFLFWAGSLPFLWFPVRKCILIPEVNEEESLLIEATASRQDSPSVHRQGVRRPSRRYLLLHLGYRKSGWNWSDRTPTGKDQGFHTRMGHHQGHHVVNCQFRHFDRQRSRFL